MTKILRHANAVDIILALGDELTKILSLKSFIFVPIAV
jgi:hypothetical protein